MTKTFEGHRRGSNACKRKYLHDRSRGMIACAAVMRAKENNMADSDEKPVMEPFPDKTGTGWHVIIRYHEGHERRIEGFASEAEAIEWIVANSPELDK
jgi:hypothetical protein